MEKDMTRNEFLHEDGHVPTSATVLYDDLKTLATIKRDFLDLCKQLRNRGVEQDDLDIAEECFDELLSSEWDELSEQLNASDDDDYGVPAYPRSESLQKFHDERNRRLLQERRAKHVAVNTGMAVQFVEVPDDK